MCSDRTAPPYYSWAHMPAVLLASPSFSRFQVSLLHLRQKENGKGRGKGHTSQPSLFLSWKQKLSRVRPVPRRLLLKAPCPESGHMGTPNYKRVCGTELGMLQPQTKLRLR